METVNAFGLACPKPLMMAKAKIDEGARELAVHVDNETAVKNVSRLAEKYGLNVAVEAIEGGWSVNFSEGEGACAAEPVSAVPVCTPAGCGYAVFIGKDHVGEGDPQLGYNLMKMAIYTLSESDDVPASVLFMNGGVKLVAGEEQQIIDSVNKLIEQGTEVLVCGTCLDFYGLKEQLKVGEVSNMYDILGRMQEAAKTITLQEFAVPTYVMAFESTHAAMASEAALDAANACAAMIPTPRAISAGCGMSMRFDATSDERAGELARVCEDAKGLAALYREASKTEYDLIERM